MPKCAEGNKGERWADGLQAVLDRIAEMAGHRPLTPMASSAMERSRSGVALLEGEQAKTTCVRQRILDESMCADRKGLVVRRIERDFLEAALLEPHPNVRSQIWRTTMSGPDDDRSGGAEPRRIADGPLNVYIRHIAKDAA